MRKKMLAIPAAALLSLGMLSGPATAGMVSNTATCGVGAKVAVTGTNTDWGYLYMTVENTVVINASSFKYHRQVTNYRSGRWYIEGRYLNTQLSYGFCNGIIN